MKNLSFLVLLSLVSANAFASNCRLIIHVQYKDGNKKVRFEDTKALSHEECRLAAQNRQLDSEGDEVKRAKVIFNYRELSVIGDAEAESQE